MATKLKSGQTILFTGDSITDCGRRLDEHRPIGKGYVSMFNDMLIVREPEKQINVINTGVSGHALEDLRNRWMDDVIAHQPDWISIKIGINDSHANILDPENRKLQAPEPFEKHFDQILSVTKDLLPNAQILLIDPFYGSLDTEGKLPDSLRDKVHKLLPIYLSIIDRMQKKYGTSRVKTHDIFHNIFKHQKPKVFFPIEPVHPNKTGHMLIAEAVYKILSE